MSVRASFIFTGHYHNLTNINIGISSPVIIKIYTYKKCKDVNVNIGARLKYYAMNI